MQSLWPKKNKDKTNKQKEREEKIQPKQPCFQKFEHSDHYGLTAIGCSVVGLSFDFVEVV
jgi:hypothetical protein